MDARWWGLRKPLGQLAPSSTLWFMALMVWSVLGCGTESAGPPSAEGDRGQATATSNKPGQPVVTTDPHAPGAHTLGDALKFSGGQNVEDNAPVATATDLEPSPEQAHVEALQERIVNAGPRDHQILADALRDPDLGIQLIAIDRLGQMPKWDPQARRMLEELRDRASNEGIRLQAAAILRGMPDPAQAGQGVFEQ